MKQNGEMLRPTADVLERLVNPEGVVRNIDDHIMLLKTTLF